MIVELESDWITGELILPIPHEIMVAMEWQEGDTLKWVDNGDGTFSLKRYTLKWVDNGDGTFSLHSNCSTPECCQECLK